MSASVLSHKFAATCSFIALFASLPAFAQDQERSHADNPVMEEIVVVGSLIKRRVVYEGRAPVQTLDAELFDSVGAAQPVDILSSLTANTGSYIATQQNYLQGVSQFSLRGVGLSSTLTLINGRRAGFAPVSNDVGQTRRPPRRFAIKQASGHDWPGGIRRVFLGGNNRQRLRGVK